MGDINEMSDKIFQYESKISKMNYQIESFTKEREGMSQLNNTNEQMKRKLIQMNQLNVRVNDYETKI